MQGSAAGDEDLQVRTGRHKIGDERGCLPDLLKIVEDQQELLLLQIRLDLLGNLAERRLAESKRLRKCCREDGWITKWGERHADHSMLNMLTDVLRQLNPEPRLADPAGPGEREQAHPIALQERHGTRHLLLSPDECCGWKR